ncbi:hypothetical protein [Sulfitobacter noctilucicola]|uniref:ABC-type transporter Mla subunit MlaD n=1 Tax=Sulfitobacter noctilucicola TaxID=1342301 RepID=A0A7W6Q3A0_9RHOB|nr:hypothetical protein [Sulfitobacter noctilucicola]MBB4172899.1 ABC-type transporter Mla subunit MlaD [Sulfitobacter noctilucicola]
MSHHQLTPFETALLRAVEDLNATFEAGLKNASASPKELENLQNDFDGFVKELEARLNGLEAQQNELRQLLKTG